MQRIGSGISEASWYDFSSKPTAVECDCVRDALRVSPATRETACQSSQGAAIDADQNTHSAIMLQESDTGIYEAHHVLLKQAGNETNCKNEHFERDQTKRSSHTQSMRQAASIDAAFKALISGDIKPSLIREDGVYIKVPRPAQPKCPAVLQAITLDKVANKHLFAAGAHEGSSTSVRMLYQV